MKVTNLFNAFFNSEKSSGILLLACAIASMFIANSALQEQYLAFWKTGLAAQPLDHWINDGLMAIFFLLIGLELKRELLVGELSDRKKALLPAIAALGGMLVPAGIHLLLNKGTATQSGAGIPMATDIAFALGALSLSGKRVPRGLKVFLTALAVIDDLGAIVTIAIFYSKGLSIVNLCLALGILGLLALLNRMKVRNIATYLIGGVASWYFMLHSGVHATVAGVLLAFVIPSDGGVHSVAYRLQHLLHKPVSFIIVPIFALANTAIVLNSSMVSNLGSSNSLGISLGLFLGKPTGIFLFSFLAVLTGICTKSAELKWKHILGMGWLGGIGFTMSIFITMLAFNNAGLVDNSKIAIIAASAISAVTGLIVLSLTLPEEIKDNQ